MPVCFLLTPRNIHPLGINGKKAMLHTPRAAWLLRAGGAGEAGRDKGCWCRNKSFHFRWTLPHRMWARFHMWAAPSSLGRSLPVLDRNARAGAPVSSLQGTLSARELCSGYTYHPAATQAKGLLKRGLRHRRTGLSCLEKSSYHLERELVHNLRQLCYLLKTKPCFNGMEMHRSVFAEMPDLLKYATAHLMLTPNVSSVLPKRLSFRYYIQPGSVAQYSCVQYRLGVRQQSLSYAWNLSLPHKCPYLPRESVYPCSNYNCPKADEY